MIPIIQFGIGALGQQVLQYLTDRSGISVVGVADLNPKLIGKDISDIVKTKKSGVMVYKSIDEAIKKAKLKPEVAVITTVSSISKLLFQVEAATTAGLNIVSTCEELIYPW